jgi:hypothetical protein
MKGYVHSTGILDMKSRGATHNVHANKNDWNEQERLEWEPHRVHGSSEGNDMTSRGATHNVHVNKIDKDGSHIACMDPVKETNGEPNLQYEGNSERMVICRATSPEWQQRVIGSGSHVPLAVMRV